MKKLFTILTLLIVTSFTAFGLTKKALIVDNSVVFSETQFDEVVPEIEFNGKTIVASRLGDEYDCQIEETFVAHIKEGTAFTSEGIDVSCYTTPAGYFVLSFVKLNTAYILYIEH